MLNTRGVSVLGHNPEHASITANQSDRTHTDDQEDRKSRVAVPIVLHRPTSRRAREEGHRFREGKSENSHSPRQGKCGDERESDRL